MSTTTAPSTRHFRVATMHDLDEIERIYAHARDVMAKNGNPTQWGTVFPKLESTLDDIKQHRLLLLVDHEGPDESERILAQFALCQGKDPMYGHIEGAWLDDAPYVTIHRIASSGLGKHAARDCITWTVNHYGNVRADTHPNNRAMQHILETTGFARCGLIQLTDRTADVTRIAYQRHAW